MGVTSIVATAAWLMFLGAAMVVAFVERGGRGDSARRIASNILLAVALGISFTAGLTRRSLWPFEAWPMFQYVQPQVTTTRALVAVDTDGREYPIDYRAWQPLQSEELISWFRRVFPTLSPDAQDSVGAFLLNGVNTARTRAITGASVGYLNRFLGPLAAPSHFLHRRYWNEPGAIPPTPFVVLQLVEDTWDVDFGPSEGGQRRLVFQFPRELRP